MAFPPPLRGPISPDVCLSEALAVTFRELLPRNLIPPGNGVVIVSHAPPSWPPATDDDVRMERRDMGYLTYILSSWQRSVIQREISLNETIIPRVATVQQTKMTTGISKGQYNHAGEDWHYGYHIKLNHGKPTLTVHLANDGYLYMNPESVQVDNIDYDNHDTWRHGWMVFKHDTPHRTVVYQKLQDFREFANSWFGIDDLCQSVKYNPTAWRIDIMFESKGAKPVGLEFSFEPSWPAAPEDPKWWD